MNIFEIGLEYKTLINMLEESGGETTDEINAEFEAITDTLENKVKAYVHIVALLVGESNVVKDEIERLEKVLISKQNTISRLKEALLNLTLTCGDIGKTGNRVLKFDTISLFTTNRKSVNIEDFFFNYPEENKDYINYTIKTKIKYDRLQLVENAIGTCETTPSADKAAIREDLDNGVVIVGAEVVTKPSITVK